MTRAHKFFLVLLVSVIPHLFGIGSPMLDYHYHRQANTATIARNYHDNGLRFLHPQIDWDGPNRGRAATEFPLYMFLIGLFWGVLNLGETWGRILSICFSGMTALLLLRFLERWLEERPAFFGALLFSLLPVEVFFGRTVQPESLALLCTLTCFLTLDIYLCAASARTAFLAWLAAWATASLAIGHKIPYAYLWGVCAILAWVRLGKRTWRSPGTLAFFPLTAIAVFTWYKYASYGTYVVPTRGGVLLSLLDYSHLLYYVQFQFLSRFPELTTTWPGFALWGMGAWTLCSKTRTEEAGIAPETRTFFWGWSACIAIYVSAGGGYIHHHDYTALPWALVNAGFMGLGLHLLLKKAGTLTAPKRGRARTLLAAVLLAMPIYTAVRIKHWYHLNKPFLPGSAALVESISGPDDLFVCNEEASSLFLYYIHRRGWSAAVEQMPRGALTWIEDKKALGGKFFMTAKEGSFADPSSPLLEKMGQRFTLLHEDDQFLIFSLDGPRS